MVRIPNVASPAAAAAAIPDGESSNAIVSSGFMPISLRQRRTTHFIPSAQRPSAGECGVRQAARVSMSLSCAPEALEIGVRVRLCPRALGPNDERLEKVSQAEAGQHHLGLHTRHEKYQKKRAIKAACARGSERMATRAGSGRRTLARGALVTAARRILFSFNQATNSGRPAYGNLLGDASYGSGQEYFRSRAHP